MPVVIAREYLLVKFIFLLLFVVLIAPAHAQTDSLRTSISNKYDTLNQRISSLQSRLTKKIDSLNKRPNPDKQLVKSLDSIRRKVDSLRNIGLPADASNAMNKVIELQGKVDQKLGMFSANGSNIPASINVSGAGQLQIPGGSLSNPIPDLPNSNSLLPDANLDPGANQLPAIPTSKVGELTNDGALNNIRDQAGDVTGVATQAGGYINDTKAIMSGDEQAMNQAEKNIETKVGNIDEVKDFQKDVAPVQDYSKMIEKWNSDPDYKKELALTKAKDIAVNHFAGHEQELKAAMEKMSSVKEKYRGVESVLDIFEKPENPMKGRSFMERLVPGFGLQVQISSHQWFDFNPSVGYRWSGRWTTGIGWVERLSLDVKHRSFVKNENAYGPRSYVDFHLKENFILKAEAEFVNSLIMSPYLVTTEPDRRAWVWSYFAGIKKTFSLSKKLNGNVQALYNLYDPMRRSPYMSRVNVRIGIEFLQKQKTK